MDLREQQIFMLYCSANWICYYGMCVLWSIICMLWTGLYVLHGVTDINYNILRGILHRVIDYKWQISGAFCLLVPIMFA
jgi:hypothetical protein